MNQSIGESVQRALSALQRGEYASARELCKMLVSQAPAEPDLHNLLGVAQMNLGEHSDAEASFVRALNMKPREAMYLANLARLQARTGRAESAVATARTALQINPNLGPVHVLLATTLMALGDQGSARAAFQDGLRACPGDALLHYNYAMLAQQQGDGADAEESYRRALALKPGFAEAHNNLGNVLKQQGRIEEAERSFRSALATQPSLAPAHSNLGLLLQEQGRHAEAVQHLKRAVELNPDLAEAHNNLGFSLLEQEQFQDAERCFRHALALNPGMAEAHNNLGTALHHLERVEEAIDCFNHAFALRPNYPEALFNLGMVFHEGKHYHRAKEYYEKAIKLNPAYDSAHVNLGIIFGKDNDADSEIACYREALALNPNLREAHHNLAMNLLRAGRWEEAWPEFAWRGTNAHHPMGPKRDAGVLPQYGVSDLSGKPVILHSEQGVGDILCYLRFAPQLAAAGVRLTFCGDPRIEGMVMRSGFFESSISLRDPLPPEQIQLLVGDLPYLTRCNSPGELPPPFPLVPLPDRLDRYRNLLASLGPPPYTALTWRAGTPPTSAKFSVLYKLVPLNEFGAALTGLSGTVVSVQRLPRAGEREEIEAASGLVVHDLSTMNEDLEDALALMSLIDLYVGVSNTNTHLRASVGHSSLTLVPHPPEWRWGSSGERSAWCPGTVVYRQDDRRNWDKAIAALAKDLETYKEPHTS